MSPQAAVVENLNEKLRLDVIRVNARVRCPASEASAFEKAQQLSPRLASPAQLARHLPGNLGLASARARSASFSTA